MKKTLFTLVMTCLVLGGCGGAHLVAGHAGGGKIELSGGYMPAMSEARMVMVEHCDGRFDFIERSGRILFTCADSGRHEVSPGDTAVARLAR